MTLTVRLFGLELLMLDVTTDPPDDGGYDHDVISTSLEAVPDEGEALGFISPAVERE